MAIQIKKITNAESYAWAGLGNDPRSVAATYAVLQDGVEIATIKRAYGGGFMEKSAWECRNTIPQNYTCFLTKKDKTASPGELVLASGPTLKDVKAKVLKRF